MLCDSYVRARLRIEVESGNKMSDPMTNTDVEDVLASIRRLVSDNARPGAASVQQPPSDRLVLTPSLRVPEADSTDEIEDVDADSAEMEAEADADDGQMAIFSRSAFSREKSEDKAKIDVRAQGYVPADDNDLIASLSSEGFSAPLSASNGHVKEDAGADTDLADEDARYLTEETEGVADAEEARADPAMSGADGAADTSESPEVPEDWADEVDGALTQVTDEDSGQTTAKPAPMPKSLSEKIAALETLVGERRDQFEPDDPGVDAYAGTEPPAMEWEDADEEPVEGGQTHEPDAPFEVTEVEAVAPEVPEAEAPEPEADDPEPGTDARATPDVPRVDEAAGVAAALFASDADVLDEDALRELISDIVREELQGALGERITRNVRKLVRREIHRALAAQDLE